MGAICMIKLPVALHYLTLANNTAMPFMLPHLRSLIRFSFPKVILFSLLALTSTSL